MASLQAPAGRLECLTSTIASPHRAIAHCAPSRATPPGHARLSETGAPGPPRALFLLRRRPVDAEVRRPPRVQRAEVLVERRFGRLLGIAIMSEILADGLVPGLGLPARIHAAHDRRAAPTDRRLVGLGDRAAADRPIVDAGDDRLAPL